MFTTIPVDFRILGNRSGVLKHHLVFDRNFNEDFVDDAIERFKKTVAYSGLVAGDKIEGGGTGDNGEDSGSLDAEHGEADPPPPPPAFKGRRPMSVGQIEEVCHLDEGTALIQLPERISKVSADDLEEWLLSLIRKAKRRAAADDSGGI